LEAKQARVAAELAKKKQPEVGGEQAQIYEAVIGVFNACCR
jgi:hypothetical protein